MEDQLLSSGHAVAKIYDKVLQESGGPLNSQSQSSEPKDKSQIYRQKNKKRKNTQKIIRKGDDL